MVNLFYMNVVGYKVPGVGRFRVQPLWFYMNVVGYKGISTGRTTPLKKRFYMNVVGYKVQTCS